MKLIIHTGWHKTGTSAIQSYLFQNKDWLLKEHGILYPETGLIHNAHHLLAWSLQKPMVSKWAQKIGFNKDAETIFNELFKEAEQKKATKILISSEEFSLIHHYRLPRLADLVKDIDLDIIAYVRRQDKYLESLYNQLVKTTFIRFRHDLKTYLKNKVLSDDLNYYKYFTLWKNSFDKEKLTIRIYERSALRDNDIISDLLFLQGIESLPSSTTEMSNINPSLSANSIQFLFNVNRLPMNEGQHKRIVDWLFYYDRINKNSNTSLLSLPERIQLLNIFEASNQQFADDFFSGSNPFVINHDEIMRPNEPKTYISPETFQNMFHHILPILTAP
jgi:hypothetical protein